MIVEADCCLGEELGLAIRTLWETPIWKCFIFRLMKHAATQNIIQHHLAAYIKKDEVVWVWPADSGSTMADLSREFP